MQTLESASIDMNLLECDYIDEKWPSAFWKKCAQYRQRGIKK